MPSEQRCSACGGLGGTCEPCHGTGWIPVVAPETRMLPMPHPSEAKRTPGPWNVNKYGGIGQGPRGLDAIIIESSGWMDNEPGDAALIAAAPDLYEALSAIQWGNDEIYSANGLSGVHHLCPECDRTEVRGHQADCSVGNALARAKGEQL